MTHKEEVDIIINELLDCEWEFQYVQPNGTLPISIYHLIDIETNISVCEIEFDTNVNLVDVSSNYINMVYIPVTHQCIDCIYQARRNLTLFGFKAYHFSHMGKFHLFQKLKRPGNL